MTASILVRVDTPTVSAEIGKNTKRKGRIPARDILAVFLMALSAVGYGDEQIKSAIKGANE